MSDSKVTFSKLILLLVMLTYFIGLFFGMYEVNLIITESPEYATQTLIALFGFVGTPISISIGFYSWKAKNENMNKGRVVESQTNQDILDTFEFKGE